MAIRRYPDDCGKNDAGRNDAGRSVQSDAARNGLQRETRACPCHGQHRVRRPAQGIAASSKPIQHQYLPSPSWPFARSFARNAGRRFAARLCVFLRFFTHGPSLAGPLPRDNSAAKGGHQPANALPGGFPDASRAKCRAPARTSRGTPRRHGKNTSYFRSTLWRSRPQHQKRTLVGTHACAVRGINAARTIATRKSAGTSAIKWPRSLASLKACTPMIAP